MAAVAMRRPAAGPGDHVSKMLLAIRCVAPGKAVLPITKLCVEEKAPLRDVIAAWAKVTMQAAMLPPGVVATGVAGDLDLKRSLADVRSSLPVRDGRPTISVKWPAIVQASSASAAKPAAQVAAPKKAASKEKVVAAKNSNGKEQRPNGTNVSKPPSNGEATNGKVAQAPALQNGNGAVAKPAENGKPVASQVAPAKKKKDHGKKKKKEKKADDKPRPEKKKQAAKPVAKEGEEGSAGPPAKKRNTQGSGKENEVNGDKAAPSSSSASGSDSSSSSGSDDEDMAAIERFLADSPEPNDEGA